MSMLADAEPILVDPDEIRADTVHANMIRSDAWSEDWGTLRLLSELEEAAYAAGVQASFVDPRDPYILATDDPSYAAHVAAEQAGDLWWQIDAMKARLEREAAA